MSKKSAHTCRFFTFLAQKHHQCIALRNNSALPIVGFSGRTVIVTQLPALPVIQPKACPTAFCVAQQFAGPVFNPFFGHSMYLPLFQICPNLIFGARTSHCGRSGDGITRGSGGAFPPGAGRIDNGGTGMVSSPGTAPILAGCATFISFRLCPHSLLLLIYYDFKLRFYSASSVSQDATIL